MRYFYFIVALCFISCKKEPEVTDVPVLEEHAVQDTIAIEAPTFDIAPLEALVTQFIAVNDEIKAQAKTVNPEQANALYDKLTSENNERIGKISEKEANMLDGYYTHFTGTYNDKPDNELKTKNRILAKAGLEIWDVGEGMAEIRTVPEYYKNFFSGRVTKDYQTYIDILAEDDKILWAADAGIGISWQDLGKRLINWENFTIHYPESNLIKEGERWYKLYRYAFFNGYDNTPTGEHDSDKLYPEVKKAFEQFVEKYPSSPSTPYVKQLLESRNTLNRINTELHLTVE